MSKNIDTFFNNPNKKTNTKSFNFDNIVKQNEINFLNLKKDIYDYIINNKELETKEIQNNLKKILELSDLVEKNIIDFFKNNKKDFLEQKIEQLEKIINKNIYIKESTLKLKKIF